MKKNSNTTNNSKTTKKVFTTTKKGNTIEDDFYQYADPSTKVIEVNGMEAMGKTLDIDIYKDMFITFFFYKCRAKTIEQITLTEFTTGLNAFGVASLSAIKTKIQGLRKCMILGDNEFTNFYSFLFDFNVVKKTKSVDMEVVEVYFPACFPKATKLVGLFLKYLKKIKATGLKSDQWNCFSRLIEELGGKFPKDYSVNDSWPVLFDEFYIDYCKENNLPLPETDNFE